MTADPYDRVPYTDGAFVEAHPDRIAVVARLSGWRAPPVEDARVLEIGCARGGHLLPMAAWMPRATCVGVDSSRAQIDEAVRVAREAKIDNARFIATSFDALDPAETSFDYVVAHGVWSWVARDVRRAMLRGIAKRLSDRGIAYVSFNVLPGWYERLAARDWMRVSSFRSPSSPGATSAAESLDWLRARVPHDRAVYRRGLDAVAARLAETDRAYLAHEYLAEEHHPELVSTFLAEAADAGLCYLGDASPASTALELLGDEVEARAHSLDLPATQTLIDFVQGNAFRRALLVRADTCAARGWSSPKRLDVGATASFSLGSLLRGDPRDPSRFDFGDTSIQVPDPTTRRVLVALERAAPRAVSFAELAGDAPSAPLTSELFDLWLATGAIDLHARTPAVAAHVEARPRACAVARWHAAHGGSITNAWHQEVALPDRVARAILARLDGTRTASDLALEIHADARNVELVEARAVVDAALDSFARSALLTLSAPRQ